MENKSGKGLIILVALIAVVIALVGGYSLGKGVFTKNVDANKPKEIEKKEDNQDNNVDENKVVDSATLEKLKRIANIEDADCNDEFLLPKVQGIINDMSDEDKSTFIYRYILNNVSWKNVDYEESGYCEAGAGVCMGVKTTDYDSVLKMFGLSKFNDSNIIASYKDMYLLITMGFACDYDISYKYNFDTMYLGKDIKLNAVIDFYNTDGKILAKAEKWEYTFKLNSEGDYYLYSVYKK
ncbi:MAG: hypothetical protein IJ574_03770 [Bacilli bacterium]|nr:hypothetical protein [Bacilli bacterium]